MIGGIAVFKTPKTSQAYVRQTLSLSKEVKRIQKLCNDHLKLDCCSHLLAHMLHVQSVERETDFFTEI